MGRGLRDGGRRGKCAKRTQFPASGIPTIPAFPSLAFCARRSQSGATRDTRPSSTLPFQSHASRAKQSQFPPRRRDGQSFCGKGVMVNSTFDGPRQNKANLAITRRHPEANRAKQSQFPAVPGGPPSPLRVAGILPAIRGRDALDTKEQGQDALATRPRNNGCAKRSQLGKGSQVRSFKCQEGQGRGRAANFTLCASNSAKCRPRPRIGVQATDG